mmetsp:Transcript_125813/g.402762  ORF Transcript_125813/g.402762 Transcript_125813/m.402762 type:complete len:169 (+) Transcript_125813:515-1021(+)
MNVEMRSQNQKATHRSWKSSKKCWLWLAGRWIADESVPSGPSHQQVEQLGSGSADNMVPQVASCSDISVREAEPTVPTEGGFEEEVSDSAQAEEDVSDQTGSQTGRSRLWRRGTLWQRCIESPPSARFPRQARLEHDPASLASGGSARAAAAAGGEPPPAETSSPAFA